eukprot:CAMPEP_0194304816 /NCGR_PEP_ID=MMETSP0171-20130528/2435_1 /TAXON_ID=218684 /ORGANISM="Corethron pennatum, Strain L29A3" /LENGTH=354 /DNA_ID=CAMNT_0039056179 /DNA_START=118 /DNA_END=1179 /DNA_ORIENTATION=+
MRFSITALAGAYALAVPSTRADRLISLDVLDSIIQTSVTSEYLSWFEDFTYGPYATSAAFATFLESQWTSNGQQSDELAPYLVCDTTPDKSGYERSQLISSQCEIAGIGENVVQNSIERTCYTEALTFGIADPCSGGENVTVVPYTSWMKVGGNTLANGFWALKNLLSQTDIADVYDGDVADRFMFYICESTPLQEMNRVKASAQEALEQTYSNTDECQSPTFTDIWNFSQENRSLQLHTINQQSSPCGTDDDCYMAHIGCALALIESLASYPFVCSVEYDARVVTYNDDGIGTFGFPGDNVITTVDEGFNIMPVVTDVTTLSNAPSIATITATTEAPTEAPVAKTEAPMAMIK